MTTGIAPFRRRDFEVSVEVDQLDPAQASEFADAICRAKPSRLDNLLEIEVMHRPDGWTHQTVQAIVDRGVRMLSLKTKYLVPSPIQADPHASMEFVFEQGNVVDQRAEMSRRSQDGDESTEPGRR
jgi:hypothetical protein